MRCLATDECPEAGRIAPGHDLVVVSGPPRDSYGALRVIRRPDAGFLAQLIVSAYPTLRASRLERTRVAAAHYAETARRRA